MNKEMYFFSKTIHTQIRRSRVKGLIYFVAYDKVLYPHRIQCDDYFNDYITR